jgi:hypothetical protein
MALRSTQLLPEMGTRNLSGGKERSARKADLTAICEPIIWKKWEPRFLKTLWVSTACYGVTLTFTFIFYPQNIRLGEPLSPSGFYEKKKIFPLP